MKWIIREQRLKGTEFNAGSKAKNDVDAILLAVGYTPVAYVENGEDKASIISKCIEHYKKYRKWNSLFRKFNENDIVAIQYPLRNHTMLFSLIMRKLAGKGIKTIAIVHDLESLRQACRKDIKITKSIRYRVEEVSTLKFFSKIIVHNDYMKRKISELYDINEDKLISLGIFDYLCEDKEEKKQSSKELPVVIAGNLDKVKSGYVYSLPDNVHFDLYGMNYTESEKHSNIHYHGAKPPELLPLILNGSFGLVWDGPDNKTCGGTYGEYMKYNNPHKTSLYLASGIPVIVWKEAAIASFVEDNQCGIMIGSLDEIQRKIEAISEEQYDGMAEAARVIRKKLIHGEYLIAAMKKAEI